MLNKGITIDKTNIDYSRDFTSFCVTNFQRDTINFLELITYKTSLMSSRAVSVNVLTQTAVQFVEIHHKSVNYIWLGVGWSYAVGMETYVPTCHAVGVGCGRDGRRIGGLLLMPP